MSTYQDGFGAVLSLRDLQAKLRTMSSGPHQWTANLVHDERTSDRLTTSYVEIWYSNPGLMGMPNELCFAFPTFYDADEPEAALVCLHSALVEGIQMGLYFEGDQLLWDPLEDYERFWPPLRKALCEPSPAQ